MNAMGRQLLKPVALFGLMGLASAVGCPYANLGSIQARDDTSADDDYLAQYMLDDSEGYFTDDVGGQITEQNSLKAGPRGPTVLEDFIFRQK